MFENSQNVYALTKAKISNQQQADELRLAKEQQAEMENLRLRLDQGNLVDFFGNLREFGTLSNF